MERQEAEKRLIRGTELAPASCFDWSHKLDVVRTGKYTVAMINLQTKFWRHLVSYSTYIKY